MSTVLRYKLKQPRISEKQKPSEVRDAVRVARENIKTVKLVNRRRFLRHGIRLTSK
jgi:hypothetical protein